MRTVISVALITIVAGGAASQAAGSIAWTSLEDRVTGSDAVVVGEITKISPKATLEGAPGLRPCTIKVDRVLKGPGNVKEITLLWRMPPMTPDGKLVIASEPPPPVYRVGQKQVWQLKKHAAGPNVYTDAHYYFKEPVARADEIAAILAVAKEPRKVLTDETVRPRLRLSAAYFLLREACTEDKLPRKPAAAEGDGGDAQAADMSGQERLDAALVDAAVGKAIEHFARTAMDDHAVAQAILWKVGCPTGELRPGGEMRRGRRVFIIKPDQMAAHRRAWANAVATWWENNKDALRLYTPKKALDARKIDPRLAEKAQVVLRVRRLPGEGAGSKYLLQRVKILKVLRNLNGQELEAEISVAHYSWARGVPDGVSTIYLVPYNLEYKLWRLVGGKAATGVSHHEPPKVP